MFLFGVDLSVHFAKCGGLTLCSHLFDVVPEIKLVSLLEDRLVVLYRLGKVEFELFLGPNGVV